MDWSEIWKWIAGVIAAIAVSGIAIKYASSRKSSRRSNTNIVSQKKNTAGGDIVGGNSTKITKN